MPLGGFMETDHIESKTVICWCGVSPSQALRPVVVLFIFTVNHCVHSNCKRHQENFAFKSRTGLVADNLAVCPWLSSHAHKYAMTYIIITRSNLIGWHHDIYTWYSIPTGHFKNIFINRHNAVSVNNRPLRLLWFAVFVPAKFCRIKYAAYCDTCCQLNSSQHLQQSYGKLEL